MKLALVLVAALAAPAPQMASMEPGDEAKCGSAEGCIIITKPAMRALLQELKAEAAKICRETI